MRSTAKKTADENRVSTAGQTAENKFTKCKQYCNSVSVGFKVRRARHCRMSTTRDLKAIKLCKQSKRKSFFSRVSLHLMNFYQPSLTPLNGVITTADSKCFVGRCQGLHQMARILRLGAALSPPVSKHTNHLSMTNGNNSKPTTSLSSKHSADRQETSINAVAESVCIFFLSTWLNIQHVSARKSRKTEISRVSDPNSRAAVTCGYERLRSRRNFFRRQFLKSFHSFVPSLGLDDFETLSRLNKPDDTPTLSQFRLTRKLDVTPENIFCNYFPSCCFSN